ncbi:dioxygenase [Aquitalea sp. S1-19]|nr:dioxygenase [Aquitalea sp. S1-19]
MRLPTLFISHGAPTLVLEEGADAQFLASLPTRFATPRAVLVVSAHWQARQPVIGSAAQPATIHDFSGFPAPLYGLQYPAHGSHEGVAELAGALDKAGIAYAVDDMRGLDHGAWVPLKHMWPDASVPVLTLALPYGADAKALLALGDALSGLPAQGVLVLGSGGLVHNLAALQADGSHAPQWALAFEAWMDDALQNGRREELLDWQQLAPHARQAHPSSEHLAPLFVVLGAAGQAARAHKWHEAWRYGSLSMAAYAFV